MKKNKSHFQNFLLPKKTADLRMCFDSKSHKKKTEFSLCIEKDRSIHLQEVQKFLSACYAI